MTRTARLAVSIAAFGLVSLASAPGAVAQTTSEYTGTGDRGVTKVDRGVTKVSGRADTAGVRQSRSATLPVTGGEVVLIAAAGAAAVAAGTVMVRGGRRRTDTES